MADPARNPVTWGLARLLLAAVAVVCGVVVLVASPHDPARILAVGVIFAALAAVIP